MVEKISKFSESLDKKSVGTMPKPRTARPTINYPDPDEGPSDEN